MLVASETITRKPTRNGSLNDMDFSSVFHVEATLCAGAVQVKNKQRVRPHHQIAGSLNSALFRDLSFSSILFMERSVLANSGAC
jgi:hypothetical protein